jgi:hypothetical protein
MADHSQIDVIDLRTDVRDPAERRALCVDFFERVYRPAFPRRDETENPDDWLPLLESDPPPPAPTLHVIVARQGIEIVAGILIEYFRASRSALVTYLAVAPSARRSGMARRLLLDAIGRVTNDNGGVRPLVYAEVERPEAQINEADRRVAVQRAAIIAALGGRRVCTTYIQPRLGPDKNPVKDLMLVLMNPDGPLPKSVSADRTRAFLIEFFDSLGQRQSSELETVLSSLHASELPLGACADAR